MATVVDLALIVALAAARRIINSEVAQRIADKMDAEGRQIPNEEEQAEIDAIVQAGDQRLDEAIGRAESEGR